ncbi:MAG TPA: hypothetical protein VN633_09475 [Bryobacteraceae bacterium]|nr:hypothetical protein [Bryobacteraceae bacterium]
MSGINTNKVAIGRVLPVVLAILFVGGVEPASLSACSTLHGKLLHAAAKSSSHRVFRGHSRTALCLVPALLSSGYQADASFVQPPAARSARTQPAVPHSCGVFNSTAPPLYSSFFTGNVWRRPPPSV